MSKLNLREDFTSAARALAAVYNTYASSSAATCRFDEKAQHLLFEVSHRVSLKEVSHSHVDGPTYNYTEQDAEELTDTASIIPAAHETTIHWKVQVMPHPVYTTPCPFIEKMWNNNGHIYSLDEAQIVLDSTRSMQLAATHGGGEDIEPALDAHLSGSEQMATGSSKATANDQRHYEFGRLTPESHPITGLPCFSMHICQLQSILELSEESAQVHDGESIDTEKRGAVQLLNWCSIVGPHFGVCISPSVYKLMTDMLCSNK